MIHEFFTLTVSRSLYRVSDERDQNGWPTVVKIADSGTSNFGLGNRLGRGRFVAVTPGGIALYAANTDSQGHPQSPYEVSTRHWGGTTSAVVGLFLDEHEAREAFLAKFLKSCDPRWHAQTRAVLAAIEHHPVFIQVPFHELLPPAA
ncbi:hypothetical protein HY626_04395 [Candidatus Uhrbacteria bacterium]|nr:hypothetical protein [Candidatus Uhrbacteria bacterium]